MDSTSSSSLALLLLVLFVQILGVFASQITLGSRLSARENRVWLSENGTFALGFNPVDSQDQFQLAIWYAQLPGDRVTVWSPNRTLLYGRPQNLTTGFSWSDLNRDRLVGKDATLELDNTGNLILMDRKITVWTSNTSRAGVKFAKMSDSGNFILYNTTHYPVWQSFSQPSDTLLPGQALTVSLELTTSISPLHGGGYYTLKMLQEPTSLSLALTYNLPDSYDALPESHTNYSYWSGPEISNVTGDVVGLLDETGSFSITYGASSDGVMYVYKNDADQGGIKSGNRTVLRRLTLETNGNLRLYRFDNDVNGSRQWVPEWAAVTNPCNIAGMCGNGICSLNGTKANSTCHCLPRSSTSQVRNSSMGCSADSSVKVNCKGSNRNSNFTSSYKIKTVAQTNYYFSESAVIANYSDTQTISKCGDACLSDCECVASVSGLNEEKAYCWILKSLDFGGYEDPGANLFVKVLNNGTEVPGKRGGSSDSSTSHREKVLIIPIVLCMVLVIALLLFLLYYSVHRRKFLKRAIESSLTVSGAPVNFSYRDLQNATSHFSELLGTGGFGSVFKGNFGDETLIAVKKLERVLPHGEKEFITEVNTIGSMHHMNLVRLIGFCSEGSQRLLVYEFMKNGSLDKWIFPSGRGKERLLDWETRFHIAISTAQGIAYFHEQCRNRIIHCDIKPENILLDENFCPKVSDFGLAKLMAREHSRVVTMIRGTRGYLAPEWVSNRPITVKADVYSYGMLLLEIIGGRRNLDMSLDSEEFFFPGWAFKELTEGIPKRVADKRLHGLVEEEGLVRAMKVAFWCIQDEVNMRPSMGEVVKMLEGSVQINAPPIPQTVLELVDEGLDQVYRAMKRDFHQQSSFFTIASHPSSYSNATCSYSSMSPR